MNAPRRIQLRCLDCAAVLYTDPAAGALVDRWGERTCSASYREHAADLPVVSVGEAGSIPATSARSAGPAAPATSRPDRLRWAELLAGAGAVPDLPPPPKPAAQHPSRTAPLNSATPGSILRSGFARGPSGPVPGAPRAGAQPTPARPQTGPATTAGGAP
jgi:hypothetical protein